MHKSGALEQVHFSHFGIARIIGDFLASATCPLQRASSCAMLTSRSHPRRLADGTLRSRYSH